MNVRAQSRVLPNVLTDNWELFEELMKVRSNANMDIKVPRGEWEITTPFQTPGWDMGDLLTLSYGKLVAKGKANGKSLLHGYSFPDPMSPSITSYCYGYIMAILP
ncbi:hypothetical protein CVT25_009639 [Psilocybe cyanescens]|uniref:Uncharacterized protein n=1 Tax=Psilocybe cyanescens TaxID=93625 RepID=A0A409XGX8_PSICY|nr:hypothetical protein CVT25_009639 [Psilocybe cyanescens]